MGGREGYADEDERGPRKELELERASWSGLGGKGEMGGRKKGERLRGSERKDGTGVAVSSEGVRSWIAKVAP